MAGRSRLLCHTILLQGVAERLFLTLMIEHE